MNVLMLVWTSVATDTRVLREATALVGAGHRVHIIGRAVPTDFVPPSGVTLSSVGQPPLSQARTRRLGVPERMARWALLPHHVARRLRAWQAAVRDLARDRAALTGRPDVVHAHDFTALDVGCTLAQAWGVPLVYDTHEYWVGRPREGRPTPLGRWVERRAEGALGARAAAVITVGDGIAAQLREDHPDWPDITVVRNTFPVRVPAPILAPSPRALVYAGRLAADRELETIAAASRRIDLPITLMGPADDTWRSTFDPAATTVLPSRPLSEVDTALIEAGIALVTHSDRWANHRLAMPNKLFHAVSLGVPVVASDVGELAAVVREHRLGTLFTPGSAQGLVEAVTRLVADYPAYLRAVRQAQVSLSWEVDQARLIDLYARVLG